ncbi:F-box only protein [Operophtera brumata]|uniref:F-box only protein n=1 Tax=Operophtera brumata TaxID=104452 RepID=A0A0L7KTU8_OPEBR|nr:F-box only protein [Operophtera brumata]
MPFISKDWRSPGEEWVKTQEGWEKKKVLECTSQRFEGSQVNIGDSHNIAVKVNKLVHISTVWILLMPNADWVDSSKIVS